MIASQYQASSIWQTGRKCESDSANPYRYTVLDCDGLV